MVLSRSLRHCYGILRNTYLFNLPKINVCNYTTNTNESEEKRKAGGFAEAFERYTKAKDDTLVIKEEPFATLFRKSKFNDLGDAEGKVVTGTIFHVVDNDLYIDFGWKFYCVCSRPQKNKSEYVRGAKVRISIKDLELSTRFLGSNKDLTILEADAILLGLVYSPARQVAPAPPAS